MKKGTLLIWKHSGKPAYEKVSDDECGWWVSLDSTYLVEIERLERSEKPKRKFYIVKDFELRPESEKPLWNKEGRLNRFGFKWPDQMIKQHLTNIYNIQIP